MDDVGAKITGTYTGNDRPVDAICRNGHPCSVKPCYLYAGYGICEECRGISPAIAERNFRESLSNKNFIITGDYVNTSTKVKVRCPFKHKIEVYPNYVQQKGIYCVECDGHVSRLEIITA
jgi:hypothetical protein